MKLPSFGYFPGLCRAPLQCMLYLLAITLPLLLIGAWGKSAYESARQERIVGSVERSVEAASATLAGEVEQQISLMSLLSLSSVTKAYLQDPAKTTQAAVENSFFQIADVLGTFDQLRLLDTSGRELVRINHRQGRTTVTPRQALQDKSGRDYVQQGLKLRAGELLASRVDLNIEHGQVEVPHVPTLRMVAPVIGPGGERLGLMVANYRAELMLGEYRRMVQTVPGFRGMLLNNEGYWLINHDRSNEWGWVLGHPERTAQKQLPPLWQHMQTTPTGVFETAQSLYVFARMAPFDRPPAQGTDARGSKRLRVADHSDPSRQWYALIEIPKAVLQERSFFHSTLGQWLTALYVVLSVVVALVVAQLQAQRRALKDAAARELTLFQDLYDRAPFGYCSLDQSGLIRRINQTLLTWLKRERDTVVDRLRLHDVVANEAHPQLAQLLADSLSTGQPARLEARLQVSEGDGLPVQLAIHPIQRTQSKGREDVRVRVAVEDMAAQHKLRETLHLMAVTDPLTGLRNRRGWQDLMQQELRRARRSGQPLAVMMLDIDHFKRINDTHGHDVGDLALKAMAEVLQQSVRDVDVVARLGGEEFVVLAADTPSERALEMAHRLRERVAAIALPLAGTGEVLRFTVSVGVACATASHIDPEALLKQADEQLSAAKHGGRNCVRLAVMDAAAGEK